MNKRIINEILSDYADKRASARDLAEKIREDTYRFLPELKEIDTEIASAGFKLMKASLDETMDYNLALENIKKETELLTEKRKSILEKNGFSYNYFDPIYECTICNDTGFKNGKMCQCLKKEVAIRSYKESGLGAALTVQTFENFNLTYYVSQNDESLAYMSNLFADAKKYAETFNGKGNLLMIGNTGLGKTHISSSIAKVVIERGYTVIYESAQKIFDLFEDKKFGRTPDADTDKFSNVDLLIIDDLGTEHVTQFTISVLYNLINDRCNNSKAIIINTNLSPEELKFTYKPRIFSRLFGDFKLMKFVGRDIRLLKLENSLHEKG